MLSWDVTRWRFVSGSRNFDISVHSSVRLSGQKKKKRDFEITQRIFLQGQAVWIMGVLRSSATSGTTVQ